MQKKNEENGTQTKGNWEKKIPEFFCPTNLSPPPTILNLLLACNKVYKKKRFQFLAA